MNATDLHLPNLDAESQRAYLGDLAAEFHFGSPEIHFFSPELHFGIAEFEFGARFGSLGTTGPHSADRFLQGEGHLRDTSFANRINQCDVAVQNIQELAPNIPGGEAHLAEIRQQVDALRTSQESIQMLRAATSTS